MINRRDFGKMAIATLPALRSASALGRHLSGSTGDAAGDKATTLASKAVIGKHIDREWFRKAMVDDLLEHWLTASVMPNGFIQENLDRQWKPYGTQREASLNGQGRQLYTLVAGYEYSQDKRYLDAITKCADFLLKMRDDKFGGFYNRVTPDFKVLDDTKTGYTSFAIFPLAHAARVTKNEKYAKAAMDAWIEVRDKMRDGQFFYNTMKRDFSGPAPVSSIGNPSGAARPAGAPPAAGPGAGPGGRRHGLNVHMFEALLALYEATKSKEVWNEITTEMAAFEKLYNYELGYLPEGFDENWHAAPPTSYNVGHLFEWGSLFSRAVELGADPKFIALGNRSVDLGLKVGYNKPEGGVWMIAGANGDIARKYMIWWTECETLKATARYAIRHGREDLWPYFDQTLAFIKANFLDKQYGGWFEGVIPGSPREALGERAYIKGAVDGPEFGAYHQTTMFTDILHLTA